MWWFVFMIDMSKRLRQRSGKTNTHHTPRVHSDDTDEFVRESVRRFFKSLSTRGMLSSMRIMNTY